MINPENKDEMDRMAVAEADDIVPSGSGASNSDSVGDPKKPKTTGDYIRALNTNSTQLKESLGTLTPNYMNTSDRETLNARLLELEKLKKSYDLDYQNFDKSSLPVDTITALVKQGTNTDLYISQIRNIFGNTKYAKNDAFVEELEGKYGKLEKTKADITSDFVKNASLLDLQTKKSEYDSLFDSYMTTYNSISFSDLSTDQQTQVPIQKANAEAMSTSMSTYLDEQIKSKEPTPPKIDIPTPKPDEAKSVELQKVIDKLNDDLAKEKSSHATELQAVSSQLQTLQTTSSKEKQESDEKLKSLEQKLEEKSKRQVIVPKVEPGFSDIMYQRDQDVAETVDEGNQRTVVTLKLDSIKVPTFNGDLTEWEEFKGLFEYLIHNSTRISNTVKFNELRNHLKGIAFDTIKGYAINGTNYSAAWADLKKRFDRKEDLIDEYIRRFLNVEEIRQRATFTNIRIIVDTTNQMIRALPGLGISVSQWDPFINFVLSTKLDRETGHEWVQKRGTGQRPAASEFLEWLETKAIELQISYTEKPAKRFEKEPHNQHKKKIFQIGEASNPEKSSGSDGKDGKTNKCFVCNGNHKIFSCPVLRKECAKVRSEMIQSLQLCFKCLLKHKMGTCKEEDCRHCGGPHNVLLCYKKENAEKANSIQQASRQNISGIPYDDCKPSTSKNYQKPYTK